MSETNSSKDESAQRSTIACQVCRRRKIKCGRELPHCNLCQQSLQNCTYPEKPLRPGPKIGSTQNPRKRKSRNESDREGGASGSTRRSPSTTERDESQTCKNWPATSRDASPDLGSPSPRTQAANIQSLSFIMHPSHESCSPEKRAKDDSPGSNRQSQQVSHVAAACYALGFNPELLDSFIDQFFENFTSFQLFREPDLRSILQQVETLNQCKALLSGILLFATKDYEQFSNTTNVYSEAPGNSSSSYFIGQALKHADMAIYECEDLPISLPLLQALILITHWLLTQGVRGRAWRYLRVAVSSAYELNMHLIDANKGYEDQVDPALWCEEEERRRAWWAIWEMDVFASVVRRCPTGIDWSQNETFLPAEDENWLRGEPQRSCTLRLGLIERYKVLEAAGNRSPKAWFLVINSLMKDAQRITSPVGVDKKPASQVFRGTCDADQVNGGRDGGRKASPGKESFNRLRMIRNALHCTYMVLPKAHRYRHQFLRFGTREMDRQRAIIERLQHSHIYSIHAMAQLTKLMIYKYCLFHNSNGELPRDIHGSHSGTGTGSSRDRHSHSAQTQALEQYSEAADEIYALVGRSYEEHYKFVNPFLANTIWLAGAVQLLYRELAPLDWSDKELTNSKLELLSMTYNSFVRYWNMSTTLQKNLEVVESEIENLQNEARKMRINSTQTQTEQRRSPPTKEFSNNEPNHDEGHNHANADPNDYPRVHPSDTINAEKAAAWSTAMSENHVQQVGPVDPLLFGNGSVSQQGSSSLQRLVGQVGGPFFGSSGSAAAVQQMPVLAGNNGQQGENSMSMFSTSESQPDLSPDFLTGMSFAGDLGGSNNNHLSNYLGEILSGGCIT